jgi:hypothetical protein
VVPCARDGRSKPLSFPRKRESTLQTSRDALLDSRFRGNDQRSAREAIANDPTAWRCGRKLFLLHGQKFLLHLLFVRSSISDCRNDREATVKVTSWRRFKVARKCSRRFGRLNEEVGTVKVSK